MDGNVGDATIVITRKRGRWRDWLRSYIIMIDRKPVGTIKQGQRVELYVPQGQHELFLKISWCKSRVIDFDAQPGAVIEFFCEPGTGNPLYDVTANSGQYITLTRVDSPTP